MKDEKSLTSLDYDQKILYALNIYIFIYESKNIIKELFIDIYHNSTLEFIAHGYLLALVHLHKSSQICRILSY